MKIVNMMNFVRRIDERLENSTARLLSFTSEQLDLVNEAGIDNTFLLQYDTICDPDFVALFKEKATERTELGFWYEVVEPLTSACGLPYRSEMGWKWDWHIIPGYSMAYTPAQREALIDEAMRKFREVFGYYPKTVAGWVLDTYTLNYLAAHYDVDAVAICRDQANTDAYTLLGGYFNQAYFPSKRNIFTPAQSDGEQTDIPVFRLLGPCPIHNYDNHKYSSPELRALRGRIACFTFEPCWYMGTQTDIVRWLLNAYYGEESLGFAYAQIGQENSFLNERQQVMDGLRMQIAEIRARGDVAFRKMGETGAWFKKTYRHTPATSVVAPDNFDTPDVQSAYYDCRNYTANLFRFEDKLFFRSLFLFDERVEDPYLSDTCTTFDAIYENLPIVDTMTCPESERDRCGLMIDTNAVPFTATKTGDGVLTVTAGKTAVTFREDGIETNAETLLWYRGTFKADVTLDAHGLGFRYKGHAYRLDVTGAALADDGNGHITFRKTGEKVVLRPVKA